ncbi:tannase/feruloyl esterase family alpha/beta hydrolase [Rhodococcus qingshengii]|uniref:tannase/feruloyl esterase family alpha/beta hydrolase n=1 Tax=Rhodococcus qingshengii TaxID=334542 RepID=UPI0028F4382F|nr:tannase/feruloyl esterase family alpha/beta hydrolase [Rhodococcus qingshengii]
MKKSQSVLPILGCAVLVVQLLAACTPTLDVEESPAIQSKISCEQLTERQFSDANIIAAELITTGEFTDPAGSSLTGLPNFCRALATIGDNLSFEVWMPTDTWNERFLGVGNGGFAGEISYKDMGPAISNGYATASTDTGHSAQDEENTWIGSPSQLQEWGRTSIHQMTVQTKEVLSAFYGSGPRYSYFEGGSTGGRQAMDQAEYYPDDYDGIVSHSPGMDYIHVMMAVLWTSQRIVDKPNGVLDQDARNLLHNAVLNACAESAAVVGDLFLNDPRTCSFDPAQIQCPSDDSSGCLTEEQVATAEHVYADVRNAVTGQHLYPGFALGSEAEWHYAAEQTDLASYPEDLFGRGVFDDPNWDWRSFNFDDDVTKAEERLATMIDATSTDLSAFSERGGKLIMTQGWTDPFQSGYLPIEYYNRVLLDHGDLDSRNALEEVQEHFRLFMIPGGGHVTGGVGPNSIDALATVREWVESGTAPDEIVATKHRDNNSDAAVEMTRPLCPYPQVVRYNGSGPSTDEGSFHCQDDWAQFDADVQRTRVLVGF